MGIVNTVSDTYGQSKVFLSKDKQKVALDSGFGNKHVFCKYLFSKMKAKAISSL